MKTDHPIKEPALWLEKIIRDFIHSPENTLKNEKNEKAWADPLIGYSRGDDPIFERYKQDIGSFYWTPMEAFHQAFPGKKAVAGQLTVISWVLPQTELTKADNRAETEYPAERWARARIFGEEANVRLHRHVIASLQEAGVEAAAPGQSPLFGWRISERYGHSSNWSERHAAHAAGLGTFGLSDGLITPRGQAMRCGSVVARLDIPAIQRPYGDHRAYCLFFSKKTCGQCIARCPAGAISEAGHDKEKCRKYLFEVSVGYVKSHFGFDGYGCGLCQTGVPCESRIPLNENNRKAASGKTERTV